MDYRHHVPLRELLDAYFGPELIEGFECPKCQDRKETKSSTSIVRLPRVLQIALKRAVFQGGGQAGLNHSAPVVFPLSIDMADYLWKGRESSGPADKPQWFSLRAIVRHHGGTQRGGHYTVLGRVAEESWYCINDRDIDPIP